jgi:hypothetical protein
LIYCNSEFADKQAKRNNILLTKTLVFRFPESATLTYPAFASKTAADASVAGNCADRVFTCLPFLASIEV